MTKLKIYRLSQAIQFQALSRIIKFIYVLIRYTGVKKKPGPKIDYLHSLFHKEEEEKLLKAACEGYYFFWEDVDFDKDFVRLKNIKTILPHLPLKGSLPILNEIKNEYFKRLHPKPFKLYYLKNVFQSGFSSDWSKIILLIEPALEYAEFKFKTSKQQRKIGRFKKISASQVFSIYEPAFLKNKYLQLLASKQDQEFSIIPILEFHNNQHEESFIFRFRTNTKRVLIAWENSKEGRATHLFIAEDHNLEDRLKLIESFIVDSTPLKRTMFHVKNAESKLIQKSLMYIETINHETIQQYKADIEFNISRY